MVVRCPVCHEGTMVPNPYSPTDERYCDKCNHLQIKCDVCHHWAKQSNGMLCPKCLKNARQEDRDADYIEPAEQSD